MTLRVYFGGTFDPVHNGHLAIARAARDQLDADIFLLPAADPPHRATPGAIAEQRAAMLDLAIEGEIRMQVDRRELQRLGRSYSFDTLSELRNEYGAKQPLAWLIGIDAFLGLPTWHRWRDLLDLAHFVIAPRPGYSIDRNQFPEPLQQACHDRWQTVSQALHDAANGYIYLLSLSLRTESATAVRTALQGGDTSATMLAPKVAQYIEKHQLYR